jgi:hypothetical protein
MMSRIKVTLAWAIGLIVVYVALTWLYGVLDHTAPMVTSNI